MQLQLASSISLGLLSGFVFLVIFLANFFGGTDISTGAIILGIIVFNLLIWFVAPFVSDIMYRWLYKAEWIDIEKLASDSPISAEIIKKICLEHNIKLPKLGMIPDENPTAFTYGSGKWNARIIISHGIITHLLDKERAAVYAHELGHIKNNDFIIMTFASTLLQILYELYVIFAKNKSSGNSKGKQNLAIIGLVSYALYFVGQYILLYLSRVREYYADEFSAKYIDANILGDALIKIAYGILITPTNNRLVESTKFIGIANEAMAKGIGMLYYNVGKDDSNELIEKSFLYDLKNPWAYISELTSTHPLTGKRISRLMTLTSSPKYDINTIEKKFPVDREKLYAGFGMDLSILVIKSILPFFLGALALIVFYNHELVHILAFASLILGMGISLLIKTFWSYSTISDPQQDKTSVIELMSDVYASPVRGRKVMLEGKVIGKGDPGYIFSEDVMLQDSTGLMHLDYQSKIPLIGNLIFSLTKVKKFMGQEIYTSGWFFRGVGHFTVVNTLATKDNSLKASGGIRFWGILGGCFLTTLSLIVIFIITLK